MGKSSGSQPKKRERGAAFPDEGAADEEREPGDWSPLSNSALALPPLTLEDLRDRFHMPLREAANELSVSVARLLRLCRVFGILRWPYRQVRSVQESMEELQRELASPVLPLTPDAKHRLLQKLEHTTRKHELVVLFACRGLEAGVREILFTSDASDVAARLSFAARTLGLRPPRRSSNGTGGGGGGAAAGGGGSGGGSRGGAEAGASKSTSAAAADGAAAAAGEPAAKAAAAAATADDDGEPSVAAARPGAGEALGGETGGGPGGLRRLVDIFSTTELDQLLSRLRDEFSTRHRDSAAITLVMLAASGGDGGGGAVARDDKPGSVSEAGGMSVSGNGRHGSMSGTSSLEDGESDGSGHGGGSSGGATLSPRRSLPATAASAAEALAAVATAGSGSSAGAAARAAAAAVARQAGRRAQRERWEGGGAPGGSSGGGSSRGAERAMGGGGGGGRSGNDSGRYGNVAGDGSNGGAGGGGSGNGHYVAGGGDGSPQYPRRGSYNAGNVGSDGSPNRQVAGAGVGGSGIEGVYLRRDAPEGGENDVCIVPPYMIPFMRDHGFTVLANGSANGGPGYDYQAAPPRGPAAWGGEAGSSQHRHLPPPPAGWDPSGAAARQYGAHPPRYGASLPPQGDSPPRQNHLLPGQNHAPPRQNQLRPLQAQLLQPQEPQQTRSPQRSNGAGGGNGGGSDGHAGDSRYQRNAYGNGYVNAGGGGFTTQSTAAMHGATPVRAPWMSGAPLAEGLPRPPAMALQRDASAGGGGGGNTAGSGGGGSGSGGLLPPAASLLRVVEGRGDRQQLPPPRWPAPPGPPRPLAGEQQKPLPPTAQRWMP